MQKRNLTVKSGLIGIILSVSVFFAFPALSNTPEAYIEAARQQMVMGDKVSAVEFYKRALSLDSNNSVAKWELAKLLMQEKIQNPETEIDELEEVLYQTPDSLENI